MILLDEVPKKEIKNKSKRVYINTLVPNFKFKNNIGKTVVPIKCCIDL